MNALGNGVEFRFVNGAFERGFYILKKKFFRAKVKSKFNALSNLKLFTFLAIALRLSSSKLKVCVQIEKRDSNNDFL